MEEIKEVLRKINLRLDSMERKLFCESSEPSKSEEVYDKSVPGVFLSEERLDEIIISLHKRGLHKINLIVLYRMIYPNVEARKARKIVESILQTVNKIGL